MSRPTGAPAPTQTGALPARGIMLMLAAIVFFTLMDATAKHLTAENSPVMIIWARYIGQVGWTVLFLAPRLPSLLRTRHAGLQVFRSILLFGTTFTMYGSLLHLDLAETVAIFQVAPLVTTFLAVLFLGEVVGPRRWAALAIGFAGALVIVRPGGALFDIWSLMPLVAATFYAAYAIATRQLGPQENPLTSFVYTAAFGAIIASIAVPFYWQTPSAQDLPYFFAIGALGGMSQLLLILALRAATASSLAPFQYVGLALAVMWGILFFDTWPDGPTLLGAAMIVGAGIFAWYRERRA